MGSSAASPGCRGARRAGRLLEASIQTCRCCRRRRVYDENRFAELRADADAVRRFEGDDAILLQLVAEFLADFRDEFEELNTIATVGFVVGQAYETVVERSAVREIVARLTDDLVTPVAEDKPTCSTVSTSSTSSAGARST